MANFKAPVAPIFNGEQFSLNGNIISAKAGSAIVDATWNDADSKWTASMTFSEIKALVDVGTEVKLRFPSVNQIFDINYIDSEKVSFAGVYSIANKEYGVQSNDLVDNYAPLDEMWALEAYVDGAGDMRVTTVHLGGMKYPGGYQHVYAYLGDGTISPGYPWSDFRGILSYQPFINVSIYSGTESDEGDLIETACFYATTGDMSTGTFADETDAVFVGGSTHQYILTLNKPADEEDYPTGTITTKASDHITILIDEDDDYYGCNHNLAEIYAAVVTGGIDPIIKFQAADENPEVGYNNWSIDEIRAAGTLGTEDKGIIVFKRCAVNSAKNAYTEQTISFNSDYVKETYNRSIDERTVYGRDFKIRYAKGLGSVTSDYDVPTSKYATEASTLYTFAIISEDITAAPVYTGSAEPAPVWNGKWYKDEACVTEAAVGDAITDDITLYCKFVNA